MLRQISFVKTVFLFIGLAIFNENPVYSQGGFDNATRALYIFDLAKYIEYGPGFADSSDFRIGVMAGDYDLIYELGNLARTRKFIQDKPVQVSGYRNIESLSHVQVLYVNKNAGFDLGKIKAAIRGKQTMLITEGYEFRESMMNFIVVENKPRFDINEEYIEQEQMSVPQSLLFTAIKTKEDWQNLFNIASEEIELQKITIQQQLETMEIQKREILTQRALLDSLDREITSRGKTLIEKQKVLDRQFEQINNQQTDITVQKRTITAQQNDVQVQRDTLKSQQEKIALQLARIDQQLQMISTQDNKIRMQLEAIEKQRLVLYFIIFVLLLVSFLGYNIYKGYRIKKEANLRLEEKNRTISIQKDEIEKQRDIAAAQRDQIAYQKRHIEDSIIYAKRIQTALIPSLELFSDKLEHFVLYKPLAIVSGDFYWFSDQGNIQIIIAADCTGHGVPGAFMSMLGVTLLNELVIGKNIIMPDKIIENLRQGVIKSLKQVAEEESIKDGMDIAVCVVDFEKSVLWYSGANCPLYLVRGAELIHYRGDKMPAAIHYRMDPFKLHRIDLQKGDAFYIFSDGFGDQFGGSNQKKFMTNQLRETLVAIAQEPMLAQGEKLNNIFEEWRGDNPQVDDVTLIGVRY